MMVTAVALLVTLIMLEQPLAALLAFLGMLCLYIGINAAVTTHVRRRARRFCKEHARDLRSLGLSITAHTDRWGFAWTRMELWLEIEMLDRGHDNNVALALEHT
mmetsp:Transcript_20776/g.53622  ORF Transcript_20776/g.53622 Transcript_20776/m.53622 type:complete len:104 (+) Transcript_20776:429-740(+)